VIGLRLDPIVAAAAMALSSLSVVTNANRLRTFRAPPLTDVANGGHEPRVIVEVKEEREEEEEPVMATVHDPVCGMDIDPATAAVSEEFEGTTYYFCSSWCLERFEADPDRYAAR
jgi:Cu+-exporting ATPase